MVFLDSEILESFKVFKARGDLREYHRLKKILLLAPQQTTLGWSVSLSRFLVLVLNTVNAPKSLPSLNNLLSKLIHNNFYNTHPRLNFPGLKLELRFLEFFYFWSLNSILLFSDQISSEAIFRFLRMNGESILDICWQRFNKNLQTCKIRTCKLVHLTFVSIGSLRGLQSLQVSNDITTYPSPYHPNKILTNCALDWELVNLTFLAVCERSTVYIRNQLQCCHLQAPFSSVQFLSQDPTPKSQTGDFR